MRNIGPLISSNVKNNLRLKSVNIIWSSITVMLVVAMIALFGKLLIIPELNTASPDKAKLELYLSLSLYTASLLGLGVNLNSLGFTSMIKEKARGNIQSLLATPLKLKDIWIAKSTAVFIPGLVVGELLTLAILIALNYIFFIPAVGFLFNPWIAINSFVVFPIIYYFLGLLVYQIGLTGKPANANVIAQIFLPVFINVVIQLPIRTSILDFNSWPFTLATFLFALMIAIIVIILQFRTTKEKVVLSY